MQEYCGNRQKVLDYENLGKILLLMGEALPRWAKKEKEENNTTTESLHNNTFKVVSHFLVPLSFPAVRVSSIAPFWGLRLLMSAVGGCYSEPSLSVPRPVWGEAWSLAAAGVEQVVSGGVWCWWLPPPHSENPHLGYFPNMLLHLAPASLVCNSILHPNLLRMVCITSAWDLLSQRLIIPENRFAQLPTCTFYQSLVISLQHWGPHSCPSSPLLLPHLCPVSPLARPLLSHHANAPLHYTVLWESQIHQYTQNNYLLPLSVERNMVVPHKNKPKRNWLSSSHLVIKKTLGLGLQLSSIQAKTSGQIPRIAELVWNLRPRNHNTEFTGQQICLKFCKSHGCMLEVQLT